MKTVLGVLVGGLVSLGVWANGSLEDPPDPWRLVVVFFNGDFWVENQHYDTPEACSEGGVSAPYRVEFTEIPSHWQCLPDSMLKEILERAEKVEG